MTAIDRMDSMQIGLAAAVGQRARLEANRLEALASDLGLRPERLIRAQPAGSAQGGPFVALNLDPNGSLFDRAVLRHQDDVMRADRLRRALATAPLGPPGVGAGRTEFGLSARASTRFSARPAFHTGIDFREHTGAPVFATAPGKVIAAGANGGYGLMVEIDHGNGLATRYAHLSAIVVAEDQVVTARQVIGRVGSTRTLHRSAPALRSAHRRRSRRPVPLRARGRTAREHFSARSLSLNAQTQVALSVRSVASRCGKRRVNGDSG